MNRTLNFEVKGNQYTIEYPTVRNFINIETQKSFLSGGTLQGMVSSNLVSQFQAYQLIDCIAHLNVLCPKLVKDCKTDSLEDLDLFDTMELLEVYVKVVRVWIEEWRTILKKKINEINGIIEEPTAPAVSDEEK